jgi:hypothetical protein
MGFNIQKNIITNSRNFGTNRLSYDFICFHTYGGPGRNLYNWFNTNAARTSAHYSVEFDGTIRQYVEDKNVSYAMGNLDANRRSISIEVQDNGNPYDFARTDIAYEACAWLAFELNKKYFGLQPYVWQNNMQPHNRYVAGRICPGGLNTARIISETNKRIMEYEKKAKGYWILKLTRPDVAAAYTIDNWVEGWFTVYGVHELRAAVVKKGRVDVIDAIETKRTTTWLDYFLDYSTLEYNIW